MRTQLRVPQELHAEVVSIADQRERSFNAEVVVALRNHVRAHLEAQQKEAA